MSALRAGGRASQARRYLKELAAASLQPELPAHNTVISAYVEEGRWQEALSQAAEVADSGLKGDDFTCTSAIDACRLEPQAWRLGICWLDRHEARQTLSDDQVLGEAVYNSALGAYPKTGWTQGLALTARLRQRTRRLGAATFAALVAACALHGWAQALEELRDCSGKLGDFIGLIQALGNAGPEGPSHAAALLRQLRQMRVQPHAALWGSALGTCGQKGAWDTALVLLKDLSQRTLQRDALCLASALGAAEVAGAWDHALELLLGVLPSDAGECWHEPTDLLCSTGLQACAQSSWHLAPELLRQASKAALQPSILSQNAVLSSLDSDSWPCALELFLGARSLSVTIRSSLIGSVATNLKPSSTAWELSAGLLQQAKALQVQTHAEYHNAVIGLFADVSAWRCAAQELDNMLWSSCKLDRISLKASLAACDASSSWRLAMRILRHSDTSNKEINAAVQVLAQSTSWPWATQLLSRARGQRIESDTMSLPALAIAIQEVNPHDPVWSAVLEQLADVRARRQVVDTATYQAIIVKSL